ncbi:MAG: hypothetical protein M0D57_15110 [Sphingobacteriales bacterium JAD_PAG50586_3]|nr:MAG: hypothetical protein M0D57_15110 [Sphingobacteriales bacterium JAD_PAG50586_3]
MKIPAYIETTTAQNIGRITLGLFMLAAGIGHLTFARTAFQAQVPNWVPFFSKDFVVVASGYVEIALALSLLFLKSKRVYVGIFLGIFFILIFPGNIEQYTLQKDMTGLDTDAKRLGRLFFQPLLVYLALWSTGAVKALRLKFKMQNS